VDSVSSNGTVLPISLINRVIFHSTKNRINPFSDQGLGKTIDEEFPGCILGYVIGMADTENIRQLQFIWYQTKKVP
jgi:hypothetical protein